MTHEYQKPFSEAGRLNAELVTRRSYCNSDPRELPWQWCDCPHCTDTRKDMKRKVNKLMGRHFYKDVE